jgi:hypothetical protein
MRSSLKKLVFVICIGFIFSTTSCIVISPSNQGKHKGWYKSSQNPHNPQHSEHKDKKEKTNHERR